MTVGSAGAGYLYSSPYRFSDEDIPVVVSFESSSLGSSTSMRMELLNASGTVIVSLALNASTKYIARECSAVRFNWSNNYGFSVSGLQIELGTTATAYEPYTEHTTPVPLGQTVYGGTLDVGTGVLTITHGRVNLGSFNYSYSAPYFYSAIANKKAGLYNIMADIYLTATQPSASAMGNNEIKGGANNTSIFIRDDRYTSGADLKNALNGIYAVYELDTPTTVQLTPAQVATLLGTNNVWSDAGAVEVEYRADPTLAYNELANVIVSLGGNL